MNKRKSIIIAVAAIAISIIIIVVNTHSQYQSKSITSFFNNDASKISKIEIMSGNNGQITSVTDKKSIKDISTYLSKLKFKKVVEEPSTGWSYRFTIYEDGKQEFMATFVSDKYCVINETKYDVDKSTEMTLDKLYDEAKQAGE